MKTHLPDGMKASSDPVAELLRASKTIAVVGLSANPARPSNEVAAYLQRVGYRIIPVNPKEKEVLGEKAYARLEDVPEKVEVARRVEEEAWPSEHVVHGPGDGTGIVDRLVPAPPIAGRIRRPAAACHGLDGLHGDVPLVAHR